ncbi:exodeoxyribonuclease VII large subunit [Algoriphagus aestuariicola]|jgi:exodeoxyribonuclease VII large subunit|uniref:Exodeoxyribonuclease 7 large subunit n=1 Tax=Algoriphagus aestuariicola TaxID=1852016 RepID=A0ABS3BVL0_9BACT|nr:exodeoxyribonuclease VII large subunit [Algoriphagus aestuariicola]MBN7803322.1 exodeoxyribonuclease VII large subunit [Algoriphagus aestuariicola]
MSPLTISQLTEQIRLTLENELEPIYWVVGELADFRQAPQGHVYFELVEKEGSQVLAKIRSNLWQFTYRSVSAKFESITGTSLKNGMKVLAQVAVNYHPVYGLSVNVKDIDPSFSLGERARIRQETIDRLTKEGLIRLNGRFELPPVVQRIAIVSSSTAAGYGDFVNQLDQNRYGYQVYHRLFNSLMQGNEAVTSLLSALEKIKAEIPTSGFDAVVIIRGGGAQLDLDCFDDYRLAAGISNFPLPIFTGIGHERDETVADLVAHTRLKTPTAVAEFLLSGFREFEENLGMVMQRLDRSTRSQLREEEARIHQLELRAKSLSKTRISLESEALKNRFSRIEAAAKNLLRLQNHQLTNTEKELKSSLNAFIQKQGERLENRETLLRQLNPESILKRGYTRTELDGTPIHLAALKEGDEIVTITLDRKINSIIKQIDEK